MHHILTQQEYYELLSVNILELRSYDEDLAYLEEYFNDAAYWVRKLYGLNHFLSISLEQLQKKEADISEIIEKIYLLSESADFYIQEGDVHFLDGLYKNTSNPNLSLEEELIEAQNLIHEQ